MLLLVRGRSGDELLECRKKGGGGSDGLVLFADGRERPVGRVQAVRARDSVSSSCRNVKIEELVVVWYTANGVHLVAVGGEGVAHAKGNVHYALVAEGRHGRPVPVKSAFDLLVRGEFADVS